MTVVVEREDNTVQLNKNLLQMEESAKLSDVVKLNTFANYSIMVDNKLELKNDIITPIEVGETKLEISIIQNYIKRCYCYKINIIPKNVIEIKLTDIIKSSNFYTVYYSVISSNEAYINQDLIVELQTDNAELVKNDSPNFIIKATDVGQIRFKLICKANPNVFASFEIDV